MHQEHPSSSPTSSPGGGSTMTHHPSMSTDSTSPLHSSLSADDNYQTIVNEEDEIILHRLYNRPSGKGVSMYEDFVGDDDNNGDDKGDEGTSLWHDLDRDGVNTPAIPS